jgi:ketosteroid isomerase-like protein
VTEIPTDEETVLEANTAFYAAFNAKDVASMDVIWARIAPVTCVHPHGNLLQGRDDVMATWYAILGNVSQPKVLAAGATATVQGDAATVLCRELVAGTALVATNLFVREGGHWRMVHHHASPVALRG